MLPTDIWEGRTAGARVLRAALTPLSWLYAAGWRAYLGVYRLGLKKSAEPHRPVVCVGNLTVGGSGKTPLTLHVAEVLRRLGREVVVGCSGYGGPRAEGATLAPPGPLAASEWGDEPAMIRDRLPETPLIVGRARVRAAQLCRERHPAAVLLMDDGFQHLPLRKHVSILIRPRPEETLCLPAGPLREPARAVERADLALPGTFRIVRSELTFRAPDGSVVSERGGCSALCAIGRPEAYFRALEEAGWDPDPRIALPDHDPLTAGNLLQRLPAERQAVVTAKDWVKLRDRKDASSRTWVIACQESRVEPEEAFASWLDRILHEVESQDARA